MTSKARAIVPREEVSRRIPQELETAAQFFSRYALLVASGKIPAEVREALGAPASATYLSAVLYGHEFSPKRREER